MKVQAANQFQHTKLNTGWYTEFLNLLSSSFWFRSFTMFTINPSMVSYKTYVKGFVESLKTPRALWTSMDYMRVTLFFLSDGMTSGVFEDPTKPY